MGSEAREYLLDPGICSISHFLQTLVGSGPDIGCVTWRSAERLPCLSACGALPEAEHAPPLGKKATGKAWFSGETGSRQRIFKVDLHRTWKFCVSNVDESLGRDNRIKAGFN
jgi:hypothetical protein